MQRIKLLKLIRYIKVKGLINKYNKVYGENKEFELDKLLSLTDDEIELICNSANDTEALFRLRAHMVYKYNELIDLEVFCDSEMVLHIIEDIYLKLDSKEYDKEHNLIKGICSKDNIESLVRIDMFFSEILGAAMISSCGLDQEMLICSLGYLIVCKCDEGANLILTLASNKDLRERLEIDSTSEYYPALLNVISKAKYDYQVEQIDFLIRQKKETGEMAFLDEFDSFEDKISALEMFTKTTNEKAGEQLILMLEEEQDLIQTNPKLLLHHLEIGATLRSDEEFVPISSIKSIDVMEQALMIISKNIEIDAKTKVRVKKYPNAQNIK